MVAEQQATTHSALAVYTSLVVLTGDTRGNQKQLTYELKWLQDPTHTLVTCRCDSVYKSYRLRKHFRKVVLCRPLLPCRRLPCAECERHKVDLQSSQPAGSAPSAKIMARGQGITWGLAECPEGCFFNREEDGTHHQGAQVGDQAVHSLVVAALTQGHDHL